jgi:signal peptidase I
MWERHLRRRQEPSGQYHHFHWKRFAGAAVLAGIVLGVGIKLFAADILRVSGNSMEPAIREGSHIVVSKLRYGFSLPFSPRLLVQWGAPKTGDVVIYVYKGKTVVKRCAAVEGDGLAFSGAQGAQEDSAYTVAVNGKLFRLTETQYRRFSHTAAVPRGFIFAVGDNEAESVDSRQYGFVSVRNIVGKVLCK